MKLYKTKQGIVVENENSFYLLENEDWGSFINDPKLFQKTGDWIKNLSSSSNELINDALAPVGSNQELWACGVTYLRSKIGRQEESKDAGSGDFYARVYEAERPEVFFKATPLRIVGANGGTAIIGFRLRQVQRVFTLYTTAAHIVPDGVPDYVSRRCNNQR